MNLAADVTGKRILITGGASGLGAAAALLLASRGAHVMIADLSLSNLEKVQKQSKDAGYDLHCCEVDVADGDSVNNLFTNALKTLGGLDSVINNAGVDHDPAPFHEVSEADFDRNIAINLKGVWLCMRAALSIMAPNGGGHIINVASIAGLRSAPSISAYSASKHGVIGLTKSAAVEYARVNIRVNAVCPSFIDTPMVQNTMAKLDERGQKAITHASPMRRLGRPGEIAGAMAWLCSDESSFMNGHSLTLDGGMLA